MFLDDYTFKGEIWVKKQGNVPPNEIEFGKLIDQAQSSLIDYINYTNPRYERQWFHELICSHVQNIIVDSDTDPVRGLIIEMPPRHGKSEIISRRLPGFYFGHYSNREIIASSYSAELSTDMCMDAQSIMDDQLYLDVFPWAYLPDRKLIRKGGQRKRSQTLFHLGNPECSGKYFSVGAGTGATGRGAALFIIDDPFKDWEEARSAAIREKRWKWYTTVATTRLAKNAVIIIVCTRWHSDDLVARALKHHKIPWARVRLQGIAGAYLDDGDWKLQSKNALPKYDTREPGQALWPDWFGLDRLLIQRDLDPLAFQAMYQQHPPLIGGGMFSRANWQRWSRKPDNMVMVRFWDLGSSKKGDYSAGVKMGYADGKYYILDVVRMQGPPGTTQRKMLETATRDGPLCKVAWEEEKGASGKWVSATIKELLGMFSCEPVPVSGDKVVRAEPFSVAQQNKKVFVPTKAHWLSDFLEEYDNFPGGAYDDQVDGGSGAFYILGKSTGFLSAMRSESVDLLSGQL